MFAGKAKKSTWKNIQSCFQFWVGKEIFLWDIIKVYFPAMLSPYTVLKLHCCTAFHECALRAQKIFTELGSEPMFKALSSNCSIVHVLDSLFKLSSLFLAERHIGLSSTWMTSNMASVMFLVSIKNLKVWSWAKQWSTGQRWLINGLDIKGSNPANANFYARCSETSTLK